MLGYGDLSDVDLDSIQRKLIDTCIEMKKIALVKYLEYQNEEDVVDEKRKANRDNFKKLLELWRQVIPMVAGRLYTHYRFTYGMRNVKGKPSKQYMKPCVLSNEVPEICFL